MKCEICNKETDEPREIFIGSQGKITEKKVCPKCQNFLMEAQARVGC